MLKWYLQSAQKYKGEVYRERLIVLDEKMIPYLLKVPKAIVVSSWRSLNEQKAMVAKGVSQTLESNHRRGMAVDIVNWRELDKDLEKVGLVNDLAGDQNHYTLEGERKTAIKYPIYNSFIPDEKNKFNIEDMKITKKLRKAIKRRLGFDPGENLNDNEQDSLASFLEDNEVKIVEKVVEKVVPATQDQVKEEAKNLFQKFLDTFFKK
mgnify:CR=1 FL=1